MTLAEREEAAAAARYRAAAVLDATRTAIPHPGDEGVDPVEAEADAEAAAAFA